MQAGGRANGGIRVRIMVQLTKKQGFEANHGL